MTIMIYSVAVVKQALRYMGYDSQSAERFLVLSMDRDRTSIVEDAIAAGFDLERAIKLAEATEVQFTKTGRR